MTSLVACRTLGDVRMIAFFIIRQKWINMTSQQNLLSCIEVSPSLAPKACVIWLHGLGADGSDFEPIVPELNLPDVRFIFPNAPLKPVTINNGYVMRAWYDITSMSIDQRIDETGIHHSVSQLTDLILHQMESGIPSEKIILAGFSQGAVIALTTGLKFEKPLGGILALSGYFPFAEQVIENANPEKRKMPIFIAHGTEDTIVPYRIGKASYEALNTHQFFVTWHSYAMGHSVCNPEIRDISDWLKKAI